MCYKGLSHVTTDNYLSIKMLLSALRNKFPFCVFPLEHHSNSPFSPISIFTLLIVYKLR